MTRHKSTLLSFAFFVAFTVSGACKAEESVSPPVLGVEAAVPAEAGQPEAAPVIVSGPLRRSDVLLSPRFYRPDWLDAFRSFSANRVVWTTGGRRLIEEAAAEGIAVQCTLPFWVPAKNPLKDQMACVDPQGAPIGMRADLSFPDVNSNAWRDYILDNTQRLVDAGCTSFQQDGVWLNYHSAIARNGCYSSESQAEFEAYLASAAPSDSGAYVESEGVGGGAIGAESTQSMFQAFQRQSTERYHAWLHDSIDAYAASKWPGMDITFSANFAFAFIRKDETEFLFPEFDFVLMEAFGTRAEMPNVIRDIARRTRAFGSVSGITIPRKDVWLNQRSIATAYALGLTAIVPWDVYVGNAPRFFGEPADFSPLTQMVRANQPLFDDYVSERDFFGEFGPVMPGQGTVTEVDRTTYPERTTVKWSRGQSFREVARGRQVVVRGIRYKTIVGSHVGSVYLPKDADVSVGDPLYFVGGALSYLVSVRQNVYEPRRKAVHAVSWVGKPVALHLHLRQSDFPEPPRMLVTPANPTPTPIEPQAIGAYYVYAVGNPIWAILF